MPPVTAPRTTWFRCRSSEIFSQNGVTLRRRGGCLSLPHGAVRGSMDRRIRDGPYTNVGEARRDVANAEHSVRGSATTDTRMGAARVALWLVAAVLAVRQTAAVLRQPPGERLTDLETWIGDERRPACEGLALRRRQVHRHALRRTGAQAAHPLRRAEPRRRLDLRHAAARRRPRPGRRPRPAGARVAPQRRCSPRPSRSAC